MAGLNNISGYYRFYINGSRLESWIWFTPSPRCVPFERGSRQAVHQPVEGCTPNTNRPCHELICVADYTSYKAISRVNAIGTVSMWFLFCSGSYFATDAGRRIKSALGKSFRFSKLFLGLPQNSNYIK